MVESPESPGICTCNPFLTELHKAQEDIFCLQIHSLASSQSFLPRVKKRNAFQDWIQAWILLVL